MSENIQLFSILEASKWATDYIGKKVTTSNIAYLIQYSETETTKHIQNNNIIWKTI
ncbi:MAG: hypothetical protein LBL13_04460 [Bacteroidales bacterium]|jgi:hypothetical protein|nr:hypothetical protein [Bacteroidales bacterium]